MLFRLLLFPLSRSERQKRNKWFIQSSSFLFIQRFLFALAASRKTLSRLIFIFFVSLLLQRKSQTANSPTREIKRIERRLARLAQAQRRKIKNHLRVEINSRRNHPSELWNSRVPLKRCLLNSDSLSQALHALNSNKKSETFPTLFLIFYCVETIQRATFSNSEAKSEGREEEERARHDREGEIKNHVWAISQLLQKAVHKNDLNFRETSSRRKMCFPSHPCILACSLSLLLALLRVVHAALEDSAHNLHKIFKKAHST